MRLFRRRKKGNQESRFKWNKTTLKAAMDSFVCSQKCNLVRFIPVQDLSVAVRSRVGTRKWVKNLPKFCSAVAEDRPCHSKRAFVAKVAASLRCKTTQKNATTSFLKRALKGVGRREK